MNNEQTKRELKNRLLEQLDYETDRENRRAAVEILDQLRALYPQATPGLNSLGGREYRGPIDQITDDDL